MYQVLARKYRPKNFHELLGQDHVSKALINAINHERLHHAYLFTGTRGVGKTTIARILAKCLNCETGVTSEPCGVCSVCQSIDSGRFIDLIEIDAASRTKVEDTRELLDNVPYAPTQGRYKVYLIDEVHMLSTHSFNALLKTLEEPPAHVKFLLATTDPQKLPITIISRCLQFVLRPLPQVALAEYLGTILTKEHIEFEPDALWQLSSSAKGSVRDALSLTDQAIAFGNGNVTEAVIRQMLGLIDQADVIALIANIYQQNTQQLAQSIQRLREQVVDAKAVFDRLAEVLHQLAILQALPNFDLQINRQQREQLQLLAQQLPAELLQLYYEIVVKSRENLALANTPMQALEMCILRLMAFKPLHRNQVAIETSGQTSGQKSGQTSNQIAVDAVPANQPSLAQNATSQNLPSLVMAADKQQVNPTQELGKLQPIPVSESADNKPQQPISPAWQTADETDIEVNQQPIIDDEQNWVAENPSLLASDEGIGQAFNHTIVTPAPEVTRQSQMIERESVNNSELSLNDTSNDQIEDAVANYPTQALKKNDGKAAALTTGNSQPVNGEVSELSPLTLLKPSEVLLEGEWTPAKWDYWVFNAREHGWLDDDELVLAKRGVLTGDIHGVSQFVTEQSFLTHTATFDNFCQKLQQFFDGINVQLAESADTIDALNAVKPEALQEAREKLALQQATHQLEQQAVTQALLQQHASINSVKLI